MEMKGKGGLTPYNMGWSEEEVEEWEHNCFDFVKEKVSK